MSVIRAIRLSVGRCCHLAQPQARSRGLHHHGAKCEVLRSYGNQSGCPYRASERLHNVDPMENKSRYTRLMECLGELHGMRCERLPTLECLGYKTERLKGCDRG